MTVPAAPIPVQTAYAMPNGMVSIDRLRNQKLNIAHTPKKTVGITFVKPTESFSEVVKPISKRPAMKRYTQLIFNYML